MEGLEVKVVQLNDVEKNKDGRIDTQFWTEKIFLNNKLSYRKIGDCLLSSQYGISIEMNEEGIGTPIYRMNEIHNMVCDLEVDKCAEVSAKEINDFKLCHGDVLFNRTNSFEWVGRTGIYYKNNNDSKDYIFASYLVRFVPDPGLILSEYLATYLNTKYGIIDIKRRARQSINQTNVNPEEVKEILIPILNKEIQQKIRSNFEKAYSKQLLATNLFKNAQLKISNFTQPESFKPSTDNVNVKNLNDSFNSSKRLDAEYYQPKYDDFLNLIKNNKEGFSSLYDVCNVVDTNFNPKDDFKYKYVELSNIGLQGQITGATIEKGASLPSRARRRIQKGDVIISSIEGSLQSCAIVPEEYHNAICSTGFYVINSKKINSETLLVLFKSELMQNILKQNCSGTILTAINKNEFLNIPVPIIDGTTQEEVRKLVQESFKLKNESERLLQIAKQAIEVAIEQNEDKALEFINKNS